MWLAMAAYTAVIVTINITASLNTNLLPEGFDMSTLTSKDIKDREYGSKMVLVVEQTQCLTVWLTKACVLIMYLRLTRGRAERIWVQGLVVYTAVTFVIMEILYLGVWCRPFHNYWAVPTDNIQCSAATHHLITNAVFNISQDLLLLAIALPMFIRTQMPTRKKVALIGVFSLGIFVIIAAAMNKYYSFSNPFGSEWTYWYTREGSTAMLVANLPFVYTLLRRVFNLRSLDSTAKYGYGSRSGRTKKTTNARSGVRTNVGTLMSRARGEDKDSYQMQEGLFSGLDGITKEVGVTFVTEPAWIDEEKGLGGGKSGLLNKSNVVTITAGEVGPIKEESDGEIERADDRASESSERPINKPDGGRRQSGQF